MIRNSKNVIECKKNNFKKNMSTNPLYAWGGGALYAPLAVVFYTLLKNLTLPPLRGLLYSVGIRPCIRGLKKIYIIHTLNLQQTKLDRVEL